MSGIPMGARRVIGSLPKISGQPRLVFRGKSGELDASLDHYGVFFASGSRGQPTSGDPVFALQRDGQKAIPYSRFARNGEELDVAEDCIPDSKRNVIARLTAFFEHPVNWKGSKAECEGFARGMMTGSFESKQAHKLATVAGLGTLVSRTLDDHSPKNAKAPSSGKRPKG